MRAVLPTPPQRLLQLTLALVKPDAVAHPLFLQAVHETILNNRFLIVRSKDLLWSRQDSQRFYQEHSGRFFYQRLVEFMASGPMRAYILAHEEAIPLWRSLMGPTKVFRAQHTDPESIRGAFGLTDTRNTVHGSVERQVECELPPRQSSQPNRETDRLRAKMAPIACLVFCLLGSFLSTTWAQGLKPRSRCPEGAYSSRQGAQWYCFVFNEEPLSFENAEAACQESAKNGHLASIKNEKEGRLVGAYVSQRNGDASYVWMGMHWSPTQLKRNGWQWTDGTWFNYSNWIPDEPKRAKWDACAGLTRSSGHKKWFDRKCDSKYPFLCKWKAS